MWLAIPTVHETWVVSRQPKFMVSLLFPIETDLQLCRFGKFGLGTSSPRTPTFLLHVVDIYMRQRSGTWVLHFHLVARPQAKSTFWVSLCFETTPHHTLGFGI